MDSEYIINKAIWFYFRHEFYNSSHNVVGPIAQYKKFLEQRDLGIVPFIHDHTYKITDQKKWLLAKLKYGL